MAKYLYPRLCKLFFFFSFHNDNTLSSREIRGSDCNYLDEVNISKKVWVIGMGNIILYLKVLCFTRSVDRFLLVKPLLGSLFCFE